MEMKDEAKCAPGRVSGLGLWRAIKFESFSFIAIMFALFFTKGYVYLETLNSRLGVPVNRLGFDGQLYAVYGGVSLLVIFTALMIAFAGVFVFTSVMMFFENPKRQRKDFEVNPDGWFWLRLRHAKDFIVVALAMTAFSVALYGLWAVVVSDSVGSAERAAFKEVRDCNVAEIRLKNTDVVAACIVGESDDMLYLVYKGVEKDGSIEFEKGILSKSLVGSGRVASSIRLPD
ncbi:TPA: hypothetical protein L4967_005767 [Pseudomonas aeruginosa]|nr:hypothetical protein [Pseudomonas aeruginosa]HEP9174897.1 hypothetical protein [Pseudomonas aeruginosa]